MKRKSIFVIIIALIAVNMLFAQNIIAVGYSEGSGGIKSSSCGSGFCINLASEFYKPESATFGIKAQLVNSKGDTVGKTKEIKYIWATEYMKQKLEKLENENGNISTILKKSTAFDDSSYLWKYSGLRMISQSNYTYSQYINSMTPTTALKIINLLENRAFTLQELPSEYLNYYIKIEPIYLERIVNNSGKTYYVAGTSLDILKYAYYDSDFEYQKTVKYLYDNQINTVKNYILTTYITNNTKPQNTKFPIASSFGSNNSELFNYYSCGKSDCSGKTKDGNYGLGVGYVVIGNVISCTGCSCEFDQLANKNDMSKRIELYKNFLSKGKKYNQLLNLDNQSGTTACRNVECNISTCSSCLSNSIGNADNFNSRNLSCYNEIIDGKYCYNSFNLSNNLSSNDFIINQGGVLFKNKLLTGTLVTKCYGDYANNNLNNYKNYITGLSVKEQNLSLNGDSVYKSNKDSIFTTTVRVKYKFPDVYVSTLDGKIFSDACANCTFLGNGIITKFIEENNPSFNFSLHVNKSKFGLNNDTFTGSCNYKTNQELLNSEKINLAFRLIDVSHPFPGKSGKDKRKVGLNWCDGDNCSQKNNLLIKTYIKDANNSYNKNKAPAKYTIRLDSQDIRTIRAYNEIAQLHGGYEDNTLICNGDDCTSTFLDGLKSSNTLKYYVNGNNSSSSTTSVGNMHNHLIINK